MNLKGNLNKFAPNPFLEPDDNSEPDDKVVKWLVLIICVACLLAIIKEINFP